MVKNFLIDSDFKSSDQISLYSCNKLIVLPDMCAMPSEMLKCAKCCITFLFNRRPCNLSDHFQQSCRTGNIPGVSPLTRWYYTNTWQKKKKKRYITTRWQNLSIEYNQKLLSICMIHTASALTTQSIPLQRDRPGVLSCLWGIKEVSWVFHWGFILKQLFIFISMSTTKTTTMPQQRPAITPILTWTRRHYVTSAVT